MVGILMIFLALLMLSHVPYPLVPRISIRGGRAALTWLFLSACGVAAITVPEYFIFPFLGTYTLWGVTRGMVLGLLERLPDRDPLMDDGEEDEEDEGGAEVRSVDYGEIAPTRYKSDDPIPPDEESPSPDRGTPNPRGRRT
jgi:hypothetical protein